MLAFLYLLQALAAVIVTNEVSLRKALANQQDVTLNANISLKSPWIPVPEYTRFFLGNNYYIKNISVVSSVSNGQGSGFFSRLTNGGVRNLGLEFNTTINNDLTVFGGLAAYIDSNVIIQNVTVNGNINISTSSTSDVIVGCVLGSVYDIKDRSSKEQAVRSNCILNVSAPNGTVKMGGVVGVLNNTNMPAKYFEGSPRIACYGKRCIMGAFSAITTGPIQELHFTDSVVNATSLRNSVVGGIVGKGMNLQLCSSFNVSIDVNSTGRALAGASVGGIMGESLGELYVINTTFVKASLIVLNSRDSSYLGGALAHGRHSSGILTNTYVVVQSLRGFNNGGHMYGGGFLGYGNATNFTLTTCYMFVPEFQFFEKPGAGGHSYYGGFFGLINGTTSDTPSLHSIQVGMGKFEVRMMAKGANVGNFGGAIQASDKVLIERVVLMGAAGIYEGEVPDNAAIFIGKLGTGISLQTILVNISLGNANNLDNTANFVNTFSGKATDIIYNSGIVRTKKFTSTEGTYENFNIRLVSSGTEDNENIDQRCTDYFTTHKITDMTNFKCDTSLHLNATKPGGNKNDNRWSFKFMVNWEHDAVGWYLPRGIPVANSKIKNPALFMTLYPFPMNKVSATSPNTGWDNSTLWRFGNSDPNDETKPVPPAFPMLMNNLEDSLMCSPQSCSPQYFFSPFLCNCLFGCPGLQNGRCTSYNGANCNPGWKTVGTSLCTAFDCTSVAQENVCGGPSVAICDTTGTNLCKCNNKEEYYIHTNNTCQEGCKGIGNGFCIESGVAVCEDGWKDGPNGLCTEYSCSSDKSAKVCGGASVATCDKMNDVCKCVISSSAYNPTTKTCDPQKCNIANGDHICIGENKAICANYAWPSTGTSSTTLCAHYDCVYHQKCASNSVCDLKTLACSCPDASNYFDTTDNTCKEGCSGLAPHTGVCIGSNKALCYKGYSSPATGTLCSQYSCIEADFNCGGSGTCASSGTCICSTSAMSINQTCFDNICIYGNVTADKTSCNCDSSWTTDATMAPLQCTKPSSCPRTVNVSTDADLIYIFSCPNTSFTLLRNITVRYPWIPVQSFKGELNGNGFSLKGVNLQERDTVAAMFNTLDSGAKIHNLIIEFATNISSSTLKKVAGISLQLNGQFVANITVSGTLSIDAQTDEVLVGGFSDECSNLADAVFSGSLILRGHSSFKVGAFCAASISPLTYLTASGFIDCTSRTSCLLSGIVGNATGNLENLVSSVDISASSPFSMVGGIVVNSTGNLTNLTYSGSIYVSSDDSNMAAGIACTLHDMSVRVTNCTVLSQSIQAPIAVGMLGAIRNGIVEASVVSVKSLSGNVSVAGFIYNATDTQIKTSGSNITSLNLGAFSTKRTKTLSNGGFVAYALRTNITDSYSFIRNGLLKTAGESFIGGFVGYGKDIYVTRSYTSGSSITATPDGALRFGGFIGECTGQITSSFSHITRLNLDKTKVNEAHFGGFVGLLYRSVAQKGVSSSYISSSWVNCDMNATLSGPLTSRVFYGGFSGEIRDASIVDSYTRAQLSVNEDINLYATGFGAFNGRYADSSAHIERCYADVTISGASDLNFEGNSAYGKVCTECKKILLNRDREGINREDKNTRTSAELMSTDTFTDAFGNTDAFYFEPGRMPMIVTTPNVDPVTNAYVYPECDPSTNKDCWDYKNVWAVSPSSIGTRATAPVCNVARCNYCDAFNPSVCQICALGTFHNSIGHCDWCSRGCISCLNNAYFCAACRKKGLTPNDFGQCTTDGLSSAAIAGISFVVILLVAGLGGFLSWWLSCRNKDSPKTSTQPLQRFDNTTTVSTNSWLAII